MLSYLYTIFLYVIYTRLDLVKIDKLLLDIKLSCEVYLVLEMVLVRPA